MNLKDRLSHAWNAFQNKDPTTTVITETGYYSRPDRRRLSMGNDQTIISSIYTRIAIDVSAIDIEHVRVDENENFVEKIKDSSLNYIFSTEANIDQTSREFVRDIVISMFDEGCVALVPIDTDTVPKISGAYEIDSIRTGKITKWYPTNVEVEVYNEKTGRREKIIMDKRTVAIIENPLYAVMNEPNSTLKRLVRKLALLDQVDEQSSSGKLNLIIQLPYIIKSEARKRQAEARRKEVEDQLTNSKYGVAYTDGTEKVVQLGHPIENNLLAQIEYLTKLLYSQLGLTESIFNGTAKEEEILNYYNRTVEPIISAITEECQRKFLTKTGRKQMQRITFFRDPFKLVPITQLADLSNSLSRNEILSSNELRAVLGFKPSQDPRADQLINSNINKAGEEDMDYPYGYDEEYANYPDDDTQFVNYQNNQMDNIDYQLDQLESMTHGGLYHTGVNEPPGGYASKYYDPEKAHEYYEKTKRLKGRRSNQGLNEEGIEAAEYMRMQVDEQHKKELDAQTEATKQQLHNIDEDLETSINKIQTDLDSALENARDATSQNLERARAKLQTVITNSSARIQYQVEKIQEMMANTDNKAAKRGFANQIESLRDANARVRDALTEQFSSDYVNEKTRYASEVESIKNKASEDATAKNERAENEKKIATDAYNKAVNDLEEKFGKIMEDEMEKIRKNPKFLKSETSKSKSSSSGSSKTSGSSKLPANYLSNIESYMKRNKKK